MYIVPSITVQLCTVTCAGDASYIFGTALALKSVGTAVGDVTDNDLFL